MRPIPRKSKLPIILAVCLIASAGLLLPSAAHGIFGEIVNGLFNGFLNLALRLLSGLFGLLVAAFIALVQFDFTSFWGVGESVDTAWRLLRDLANMLIIIGMLYIAFSTILKVGSAKWKNLAGGLLIMAVAVNFSKTIALIILDAGQMLMMTFVRAFQDIAVDNLTSGLMITKIYNQGNNVGWNLNLLTTWATQWLMIFMMIITVLVMLVIVILLIIRIVMIWFFVAVSPIAFAGYALPALKKHASQWWSFYVKLVFFGPMLAFFLWFSFLFMSKGIVPDTQFDAINQSVGMNYTDQQYFASQSTTPGNVIKFLLAVILLIVGTGMAIKAADFGGKAAGAVWGSAGGWADRWRAKGGKLRDLPGAKLLGKMPGISHLGKGIGALRSKFELSPEDLRKGKRAGLLQTLAAKGRAGITAGEFKWADSGVGKLVSRFANLHPVELGIVASSTGGRETIKAALAERDRQAKGKAAHRTSMLGYYLAHPDEAPAVIQSFIMDNEGKWTDVVRQESDLKQKMKAPEELANEGEKYYNQIDSDIGKIDKDIEVANAEIDAKILDAIQKSSNKDVQNYYRSLKGQPEEMKKWAQDIRNGTVAQGIPGLNNINNKALTSEHALHTQRNAQRQQDKTDLQTKKWDMQDELNKAQTDEEKQKLKQRWGRQAIDDQISKIDQHKSELLGIDLGVASLDTTGITTRQDKLNNLMKQELELLNKLKKNPQDKGAQAGLQQNDAEILKIIKGAKDQEQIFNKLTKAQTQDEQYKYHNDLQAQIEQDYKKAKGEMAQQESLQNRKTQLNDDIANYGQYQKQMDALAKQKKKLNGDAMLSKFKAEYNRKVHEKSLISKEKDMIRTSDYPTLIAFYKQAVRDQNVNLAKACMEKLMENNNINELIKDLELPSWESPKGLHELGDKFKEQFRLTEQDAYGWMKEIVDMAEDMNIWTYAYSYAFKDGKYVQLDEKEQAAEALPMMEKRNDNEIFAKTRLSIGWTDRNKKYHFTPHGAAWLRKHYQNLAWPLDRNMVNAELLRYLLQKESLDIFGPLFRDYTSDVIKRNGADNLEDLIRKKTWPEGIEGIDDLLGEAYRLLGIK